MTWEVRHSPLAATALAEMKAAAEGAPAGSPATAYDAVAKLIKEVISDPRLAIRRNHMLKGTLANVLRVKTGRLRIFFLASSARERAVVLWIGYRKEGDRKDAYTEFERLLRAGTFDQQFAELGVAKP